MDDVPEGTDSIQNAAKVFNISMLHVYIVYVLSYMICLLKVCLILIK